uniref:Dehydrogenase/reductase (SDR family) member 7C n=1 Tax=Schistocephalus solidus TaxID=70667 RepID=A0A183T7L0_SCHSO
LQSAHFSCLMGSWTFISLGIASVAGLSVIMLRRLLHPKVTFCDCASGISKHAVITGATSGIGLATARELACRNWSLLLACRDTGRGEAVREKLVAETGNSKVLVKRLDLEDPNCIRKFAQDLPHFDVLINNAGIMSAKLTYSKKFPTLDTNMMTNFLGCFFLCELLLPHLKNPSKKAGPRPRLIFVSSALASRGNLRLQDKGSILAAAESGWTAQQSYANSKQALNLYIRELCARCGTGTDRSVDIYGLVTGGMVNTNLNREIVQGFPWPIQWFLRFLSRVLLKTPHEGCQSVVHCSVSDDVYGAHFISKHNSSENGSGCLYRNCVPVEWPTASGLGSLSAAVYQEAETIFEHEFR